MPENLDSINNLVRSSAASKFRHAEAQSASDVWTASASHGPQVPSDVVEPIMQLEAFLEQTAAAVPDKTALVCGQRAADATPSWRRRPTGWPTRCWPQGVQRGDRVAIYLENGVEAVVAIFAILKAGAVFMMVNPTTKADKLAFMLEQLPRRGRSSCRRESCAAVGRRLAETPASATVVATGPAGAGALPGSRQRTTCVGCRRTARSPRGRRPRRRRSGHIDIDLAVLIYTSGSTGNAQGSDAHPPEHGLGRHVDHHATWKTRATTSSSTSCRCRSTTGCTRC